MQSISEDAPIAESRPRAGLRAILQIVLKIHRIDGQLRALGEGMISKTLPGRTGPSGVAYLLAQEIDRAYALVADAEVLGWSNTDNAQSIVVPYLLVYHSGNLSEDLPPNLTSLWKATLSPGWSFGLDWDEPDPRREQLERAYFWSIPRTSMEGKRELKLDIITI